MLGNLYLSVIIFHTSLCENVTKNDLRHARIRPIRYFPQGFRFGVATASYQVEGAWDEDGKSPSIWDVLTHNYSDLVKDGSNGDIAANSYHMHKRDVDMLRELGVDFYKFSISWTRILPTGFPNRINEIGISYYNRLIDEMLKYGIEPMVTLYHWDLPHRIQLLGGWTNSHIIDWFTDYAHVVFNSFGDRVKHWITINEPYQICYMGYGHNYVAPAVNVKGIADYICAKNVLLAHAKTYRMYHEEFRPTQGGIVFMTFSAQWYEPATYNDTQAAEDSQQFMWALYVHPIHSSQGDYPSIVRERVGIKSYDQGFPRSRLIELSREEVSYIRGTSDIFGLNHYTTFLVHKNKSVKYYESPSLHDDNGALLFQKEEWRLGDSGYIKSVPWGFYKLLTKIREDYDNPPIFICETGFATHGGLDDDDRIYHLRSYLSVMLDAMDEGSDIRAFTVWSLMDSFEWTQGYEERFGLYEVDYDDPDRTCTPRKSAFVYKHIAQSHVLDFNYEPTDRPRHWKFKTKKKDQMFEFILKANSYTPIPGSNSEQVDKTENTTNFESDSDQIVKTNLDDDEDIQIVDHNYKLTEDDHNSKPTEEGNNSKPTEERHNSELAEDSPFPDFVAALGSAIDLKPKVSEFPPENNFYFDPGAVTRSIELKNKLSNRKSDIWNASFDLSKSMKLMTNVTNEIVKTVIGL